MRNHPQRINCVCGDMPPSDLKQRCHAIRSDSAFIANFGKNNAQFLFRHFLSRIDVVQDLLQTRQNDPVFRILRCGNNLLLESSWCALRITVAVCSC